MWLICGLGASLVAVCRQARRVARSRRASPAHDLARGLARSARCMNTRGLMELVVLNIGYDMGILSPTIFTMLVLMALVTTVMTGPLVSLLTGQPRLDTVTLRSAERPAGSGNP